MVRRRYLCWWEFWYRCSAYLKCANCGHGWLVRV